MVPRLPARPPPPHICSTAPYRTAPAPSHNLGLAPNHLTSCIYEYTHTSTSHLPPTPNQDSSRTSLLPQFRRESCTAAAIVQGAQYHRPEHHLRLIYHATLRHQPHPSTSLLPPSLDSTRRPSFSHSRPFPATRKALEYKIVTLHEHPPDWFYSDDDGVNADLTSSLGSPRTRSSAAQGVAARAHRISSRCHCQPILVFETSTR